MTQRESVEGEDSQCLSGCASRVNKFLYVPIEPQLKQRLEGELKVTYHCTHREGRHACFVGTILIELCAFSN